TRDRMCLPDCTACRTIRDVRPREFERPPAIVAATGVELRGMIREREQMFAFRDQLRREASRCWRGDWSDGRLPRQHAKAYEPEASESDDGNEQLLEHGVLRHILFCLRLRHSQFP